MRLSELKGWSKVHISNNKHPKAHISLKIIIVKIYLK